MKLTTTGEIKDIKWNCITYTGEIVHVETKNGFVQEYLYVEEHAIYFPIKGDSFARTYLGLCNLYE